MLSAAQTVPIGALYGTSNGSGNALNNGIVTFTGGSGNNTWTMPTNTSSNTGGYFIVDGDYSTNIGVEAQIIDGGNVGSSIYGVIGSSMASNCLGQVGVWGYLDQSPVASTFNYGVLGDLSNLTAGSLTSGDVYYAIYGIAPAGTASSTSSSLVNGTNPYSAYAGYFEGDVFSSGVYYYSDAKLKQNITDYKGALDKLNRLDVKNYTFNQQEFPTMNLPQGPQVGVIAEDLKKVFPNLVKHTIHPAIKGKSAAVDFDAVNYDALIPVLVQAVKELDAKTDTVNVTSSPIIQQQQAQIEQLTGQLGAQNKQFTDQLNAQSKQLDEFKNMLNDICNLGCPGLQNSGGNAQDVVLFQSIPNPTSGNATIGYVINIPFATATIIVSNTDGLTLQEFKIAQQGKGSIIFDGNKFSSGTFRYSLYIDGKLYGTKSIVMTKD